MKEKGFTLIELLAVIVVLAIIALIATPMVLDTIEKSRKGAASSSTYSYVSEVEAKLATYMLKNTGSSYSSGKYSVATLKNDLDIELKGSVPTEGNICIGENGLVVEASLKVNGYVVSYDGKNATTTDEKDIEDIACDGTTTSEVTVYPNGTPVYFNPETGSKCDANDSVSTTGTKTGCMKWYIFNDNATSSTVNMILDHNTTTTEAWNSSGNNTDGMNEVATALAGDTSTWISELNPRLIGADEIAKITGADITLLWNSSVTFVNPPVIGESISWFYFDGARGTDAIWRTQVANASNSSNYAWLYDYTNNCKGFGCNIEDARTNGYWTNTAITDVPIYAWYVSQGGMFSGSVSATQFGVRPVITIDKSIINV